MGEGDKREGADDLFEDLDKFFAPIKDVDWPDPGEPEPGPAATAPAEEHVDVHPNETSEPEAEPEPPAVTPTGEPEREPPVASDEPEEVAWYDTQSMEPISDEPEGSEETVVVPQAEVPGQEGLFAGEAPLDADDEEKPPSTVWHAEEPSAEEVEAAAEHFAESIHAEEPEGGHLPAETADVLVGVGADEVEDDILSDLEEPAAATRTVKVGAEGLGGPSWQEPTSMEVGADIDRRGERDMPAAFVTGLVLVALAFVALLVGRPYFAAVAGIVVLVAQGELFGVMHKHHHQPATAVGLITGALILWGAYDRGEGSVLAMFALGVFASFLWFMAVPAVHRKDTMLNIGLTVFNVAYIPVLGAFVLLTLGLGRASDGRAMVATVVGLTFVFDTVAFLAGATFGGSSIQRPLAPDTSPKKSWEGVIIAAVVTVIVSMALVPSFVSPFDNKRVESLLLALVISAAAAFGDLAESLIKRDLKIKDMGSILPGHGGVLDRIDSLLFTAPAAYLLFRVIFS